MRAVEALVKKKLFLTSHLRHPPVAPEEFTIIYTNSVVKLIAYLILQGAFTGPALKMSARPLGSYDTQNFFDEI